MGATVKFDVIKDTKGKNLHKLIKQIDGLDKKIVKVGLPDSPHEDSGLTVAQLGAVHEYGAPGAGIPERPFLANSIKAKTGDLKRLNAVNITLILRGAKSVDNALGQMGAMAQGIVQQYIVDGDFAPLSPVTIARKGSSKPLIDTGQMRQSVSYVVEDK